MRPNADVWRKYGSRQEQNAKPPSRRNVSRTQQQAPVQQAVPAVPNCNTVSKLVFEPLLPPLVPTCSLHGHSCSPPKTRHANTHNTPADTPIRTHMHMHMQKHKNARITHTITCRRRHADLPRPTNRGRRRHRKTERNAPNEMQWRERFEKRGHGMCIPGKTCGTWNNTLTADTDAPHMYA